MDDKASVDITRCPACITGTLQPVITTGRQEREPSYVRFSVVPLEQASNLIVGGPGFVTKAKFCQNCGYVAFFYDADATFPKKHLQKKIRYLEECFIEEANPIIKK